MWPYPWTHVGTPSHLGHMDWVAATMPSQAHAGAAQEAPDIGQWEGQDVPLVRPSSCNVKGGIPSSRRYLPTYLHGVGGKGRGATRQGAGEGGWPLVDGLASVPRGGIGMVGRCSPASRPTNRPTIPAAAIPGDGDDVPAPADVTGHAATGAHATAPAGRWDSVGSAGREERGAQEGVGEVRGGREEPAG